MGWLSAVAVSLVISLVITVVMQLNFNGIVGCLFASLFGMASGRMILEGRK